MQLVSEKKIYKLVIIIQIIYRPNVYTNIVLSTQGITWKLTETIISVFLCFQLSIDINPTDDT